MKEYLYVNKDGRSRLVIKDDNGKITSKSYPRVLMEEAIGRPLEKNEDVHHIDGNPSNNDLSNLEIINHSDHVKQHNPFKYVDTIKTCCVCGREFVWSAKAQRGYFIDLRRGLRRGICCSRRCSSLFGLQK